MKATTVKLEGELLKDLERSKPASESLSAYVRKVLRKDLLRLKLTQAAASYQKFLTANPEEQSWLKEWDEVDLAAAPKRMRQ
jgi:hypothetical protein